ncbi:FAD synthase [Candidatus Woesearchaeota archaeon]|nr:FAD synthase [Candidatus Woesearchaeota archaeon]
MVFGSFDPLHKGHRNLFQQAKKQGEYLIVVVARDETIRLLKKHEPSQPEEVRRKRVEEVAEVDSAVLGNPGDKYAIIQQHRPDIICLGYDQSFFVENLQKQLDKFQLPVKIVRLLPHHPDRFKSSKLRKE